MERYVARRSKYPVFVILCLLCFCLCFAGCNRGEGETTTEAPTDPVTEITTSAPEVTTEIIPEETTAEITEEDTTEPPTPETTVEPKPAEVLVYVYELDGKSIAYPVEVGKTLPSSALEAISLPSDSKNVKVDFKGWEYSVGKDGERKIYDVSDPPAVTDEGLHIYPVVEYSYLVSFGAGEGAFREGTVTEFYLKAGELIDPAELLTRMPEKAEDAEYIYPLLGFSIDGTNVVEFPITVGEQPLEFTALYGKETIEYSLLIHTEYGELIGGGKSKLVSGTQSEIEAALESYSNYKPEDVYLDNARYIFKELKTSREGREWTLELVWDCEILKYSVTLDHDDGNPPTKSYVATDGKLILPIDPRHEDEVRYYNFVGWRDHKGHLYNGGYEYTVSEDVSFKAEYIPGALKVYTVVFDTEIGFFPNGSSDVILTGHYGDPLLPPAPPETSALTFGEVVYRFAGWDREVAPTFTEDASYTAVYTTDKPVYYVYFYINDELWLSVPHYEGTPLTAPDRPEGAKGKIFSGWLGLPEIMPAHDLYVKSEVKDAEVIYILDGEVISKIRAEVGSLVTLAAPAEKQGHTVSGWVTTDIVGLESSSFIMPEADVRFSAESTPKPHTVNYILDGVTVYTDSVLFGEIYTVRGIEVRPGYDFMGWRIQDTALDASGGIIAIPDNDIVFIGSFERCSYKVNYYLDGILLYTDTYGYGEKVTLRPDEEMEGCSFAWSSAGANILSGYFNMPAHDVDVFGAFSDGDNRIVFIIDGKPYGTIGVRAGQKVNLSLTPTKNGYTFTGWHGDDIDISSGEFIMPEGDVILRGSFVPNAHSISFIDIASGETIGTSYLDYGSAFSLGDRVYCVEGKASTGWVLLEGDAMLEDGLYIMPDAEVVFGIVWEKCLTLEIEEGYWVPYYDHLEYECEGCRFDEETKTLYISDPSVKVAGSSDGITVVFDYQ